MEHSEPRINDAKRKPDEVNLIHEFLLRNNLLKTANLLKNQALIADKENVEQYINTIKDSKHLMEEQKCHKIKTQLEKRYLNQISHDNFDSALKIFNEKMPEYFGESQLQRFAQNLFPSADQQQRNQKDQCLLLNMFSSYFNSKPTEDAKLPNTRTKIFTSDKEIWFVKFSGKYLLAIDQKRKGMIFSKHFDYMYEKQNMHEKTISNVKWRNQQQFATSSESGQIKLWNYKLEQLHVFKDHKKLVTSFEFFSIDEDDFIVSGGHEKFIIFRKLTQITKEKTKIKTKDLLVKDIKYDKKRKELIFLNEKLKDTSMVKFLNPDNMKWGSGIKADQIFFEMEISPTDDVLHVIALDGQIVNYSLKTHEKLGVFLGTKATTYVIRMEKGGHMNQYLATGSQSGQILIYHAKKVEPIQRLKTLQKTVVNSVTWIDSSTIVCACDNGKIQYWTYQDQKDFHSRL